MSYALAYFRNSLTSTKKQEDNVIATELKVGDKISLQFDKQTGDDEDGVFNKDVIITKIYNLSDMIQINFKSVDGFYTQAFFDEPATLENWFYYKKYY